jgi:DNA polymerase I-like protein with 3'-5' exonuclease and polymerase domains
VSAEKYAIDEARRKLKLKKEDGYDKLPREVVYPYAKKDAEYTLRLYEVLMREMDQQDDALRALYQTEMKLSLALLKMEQAGVGVDLEYATSKYKELNAEVYRLEQFVLEATEEEKFSQHHEWIKGILSKRGHTVQNTQRETLELVDDEVAQAIVERGRVKKTADYFAAITREQVDGVLHTSFKQHKPVTGRMSSGEQEVT